MINQEEVTKHKEEMGYSHYCRGYFYGGSNTRGQTADIPYRYEGQCYTHQDSTGGWLHLIDVTSDNKKGFEISVDYCPFCGYKSDEKRLNANSF